MRLTREELRIAAERAEQYPAGVSAAQWGYDLRSPWSSGQVEEQLRENPRLVEQCCPACAVAVHRWERSQMGHVEIYRAMADLLATLKMESCDYTRLLKENPPTVARLMRAQMDQEDER